MLKDSNPAVKYCKAVLAGKINAPKFVKIQCEAWLPIAKGKNKKYIVSEGKLELIMDLLDLLIVAKGLKAGKTVKEALSGFQWLFIIAVLCTVERKNPQKRKYETAILEICRKNGKTFLIAVLFILLFLMEPKFSMFYSVAPDGALSRELKDALEKIIQSSPALNDNYKGKRKFKILRDYIYGGAFYFTSRSTTHNNQQTGGSANTVVNFDASRNWTGATSSAGAHSHTVTVGNTGSGTAMSLVQPSKAVARWLRTA